MNISFKIVTLTLILFIVVGFKPTQLYAQLEPGAGVGCPGCQPVGGPGQPPINNVNYNNPPTNLNAQTPGGTPGEYDPATGEFRPLIERGGTTTTQGTATQSQQAGGIPAAPPPNLPQVTPTSAPPPPPAPTSAPQQTVYGAVFNDVNKNCKKDSNESLLNGWSMFRGYSSQVSASGGSVPSACWFPTNDPTHQISDDVNYSMTYDPSNVLNCASGAGLPFYITTQAPDSFWQPPNSCAPFGYATAPTLWSVAVHDNSGFQDNKLRVDFPMEKPGPDLFTEAVGIEGGTGGNGADRTVTAHVGQSLTLSGMITNIGKQSAKASTARFCIDNTSCLTSANGKIAELPTPALDVSPSWGGSGQYYQQTTTNWVVNVSVGTHTIWLCADVFDTSGEGPNDKLNNCGTHSLIVVGDEISCNSSCSSNADCANIPGGCNACLPNGSGGKSCQNPPACNSSCSSNADCANIPGGCNQCLPNGSGRNTCQQPPACNSACSSNADCANIPGGCNQCLPGANGVKTCQNPPACNSACSSNADCANIPGGCNQCLPNPAGVKSCQNPPACNSACSSNADCANVPGGCNQCLPNPAGGNSCQQPPACNTACSKDADCAGAKDGCTACVANANGSKSCQPPMACNSACTKDSDCNSGDALKNGCTACQPDANGQKVCKPPMACNSTCTKDADCNSGSALQNGCTACLPGANGQNVCKPPIACNSACTKDSDCNSGDALKNGCTACLPGANGQNVCKPPMACNSVCTKDADCNSGNAVKNGCISCVPGANGVNTCQKPAACNSACTKDSDCNNGAALKDGCTSCIGGACSQFSTDMCKCDGIESSPLATGEKVSVTNFEKVEGGNTKSAKVKDMTFYLTQDDKIISKSQPIPATVESSSTDKVRYKSTWSVDIPANTNPNSDYRIFAQVNCVKKDVLAYSPVPNRVVLGEATQNQNIFSAIASFFSRLFGGQTISPSQVETPAPTPTTPPNNPLQIGTFNPGTIIEKSCRFIRFKFK